MLWVGAGRKRVMGVFWQRGARLSRCASSHLLVADVALLNGGHPSCGLAAKELRRANEILKLASAFFAQAELDRRLK